MSFNIDLFDNARIDKKSFEKKPSLKDLVKPAKPDMTKAPVVPDVFSQVVTGLAKRARTDQKFTQAYVKSKTPGTLEHAMAQYDLQEHGSPTYGDVSRLTPEQISKREKFKQALGQRLITDNPDPAKVPVVKPGTLAAVLHMAKSGDKGPVEKPPASIGEIGKGIVKGAAQGLSLPGQLAGEAVAAPLGEAIGETNPVTNLARGTAQIGSMFASPWSGASALAGAVGEGAVQDGIPGAGKAVFESFVPVSSINDLFNPKKDWGTRAVGLVSILAAGHGARSLYKSFKSAKEAARDASEQAKSAGHEELSKTIDDVVQNAPQELEEAWDAHKFTEELKAQEGPIEVGQPPKSTVRAKTRSRTSEPVNNETQTIPNESVKTETVPAAPQEGQAQGRANSPEPGVGPLQSAKASFRGALSPEDATLRAENVRKVSKTLGVQVFEDSNSAAHAGAHYPPGLAKLRKARYGYSRLNESLSPQERATVMAHETAHAFDTHQTNAHEHGVYGQPKSRPKGDPSILIGASVAEKPLVFQEWKTSAKRWVGDNAYNRAKGYYEKPVELWARAIESVVFDPAWARDNMPLTMRLLDETRKSNRGIDDLLRAASGESLESPGTLKFLADSRQAYRKSYGDYIGERIAQEESVFRAMKAKAIEDTLNEGKKWHQNIKDDQGVLQDAVEGILETRADTPVFGTRKKPRTLADDEFAAEYGTIESAVSDPSVASAVRNSDGTVTVEEWRFRPEKAKAMFDSLSDAGKRLVLDTTAIDRPGLGLFNRENLRIASDVEATVEGWMHHIWKDSKGTAGKRFTDYKESFKRERGEATGFERSLLESMSKAVRDHRVSQVANRFNHLYLTMTAEPLAQGDAPNPGWVAVKGDLVNGFQTAGKNTSSRGTKGERLYQVPKQVLDRYTRIVAYTNEELSVMDNLARMAGKSFSTVLAHPKTASVNFASGAFMYAEKIMNDGYLDILDGTGRRTKSNIMGLLTTITPKGRRMAPDWTFGGDSSTLAGTLAEGSGKFDRSTKALTGLHRAAEAFWKKAIVNSERLHKGQVDLTDPKFLGELSRALDKYTLDYEVVPDAIDKFRTSSAGRLAKPFATYGYKYVKHVAEVFGRPFDHALSPKERVASALATGTIIALLHAHQLTQGAYSDNPVESKGDGKPGVKGLSGRLKVGDVYIKVSQYSGLNTYAAMLKFLQGNPEGFGALMRDTVGGLGPLGDVAMAAAGYTSDYTKYQDFPTRITGSGLTLVPFQRQLGDIVKTLDQEKRGQSRSPAEALARKIPGLPSDAYGKSKGTKTEEDKARDLINLILGIDTASNQIGK